jgi:hypothetical protein
MSRSSTLKVSRAWARFKRSRRAVEKLLGPYLTERARSQEETLSADHRKVDATLREIRELGRTITPLWGAILIADTAMQAGWVLEGSSVGDDLAFVPSNHGRTANMFAELVDLYAMNCKFVERLMRATHHHEAA